jgi:hypothetical protein
MLMQIDCEYDRDPDSFITKNMFNTDNTFIL